MERPDVSVVVSTRNRAPLLVGALRALVDQHTRGVRYEVIVVDNGSSDATPLLIDYFTRHHGDIVRTTLEPRPGLSYGRNAGLLAARAPLIAFTDDDVRPGQHWVARAVQVAEQAPEAAMFGGKVLPQWPAPPPRWLGAHRWSPLALADFGDDPFVVDASKPLCLVGANLIVRRKAFDQVGLFSTRFTRAQDHEWQLRFWRSGGRGRYEPRLVVISPVDPQRMTRRYHWRWEGSNGRYCARMRLREAIDAQGAVRLQPVPFRRVCGVPLGVYRAAAGEAVYALAHGLVDPLGPQAVEHVLRARHLAGYIAETATCWWGGTSHQFPLDEAGLASST
jgi:glucosyl-dolichyl phosphate glucuronosyltransferase